MSGGNREFEQVSYFLCTLFVTLCLSFRCTSMHVSALNKVADKSFR